MNFILEMIKNKDNLDVQASAKVILAFAFLIALTLFTVFSAIRLEKNHKDYRSERIIALILVVASLFSIIFLGKYVNPFPQTVEYTLHNIVELPEEKQMKHPEFWRAYFEVYGETGSEYFSLEGFEKIYGPINSEFDLDDHTYIITYGQELESLSYIVWHKTYFGAYSGIVELSENFDPSKIYIYELDKKIRIDNDV